MDKSAIRSFAIEARKILMKSAITEARFYGVTQEECKDPIQKGPDFEVYETIAGTENRIFGDDIKRRANLVRAVKELGFEQVIEETAYTWFNRIIAIRFMEINNYLPTRVRVLSSETGSSTPDIITQSDEVDLNMTSEESNRIQEYKNENKYDQAFTDLFIKQCNALNEILPGLFEKTDDYMELLLKLSYTSDGVVRMLVDTIPEDNFNVETEGQVEIIGWMYQYYNTELKDDTFAKLKKNVKITKERIPAATQLFTPDWIVRYMVENSLGRVWIEHLRAIDPSVDEKEKAEEFGWKYYLPEAEQEEEVVRELVEIRKEYKDLTPQDITAIDPCMGSGHILVYMFDVLMDIYVSEGYNERDAVFDILEKNIHGLDIDRRAYQLSYFALMMKARSYNRVFFRGRKSEGEERILVEPSIVAFEESNYVNRNQINLFGANMSLGDKENCICQLNSLLDELVDAKIYGSIINIKEYNWQQLQKFVEDCAFEGQMNFEYLGIENTQAKLKVLLNQAELISKKYHAVITNPPYMGSNGMNPKLSSFIKKNYPDEKSDLFAAFLKKGCNMLSRYSYNAMVTMQSWMFLESFEKTRENLLNMTNIINCVHMSNMVMGIAFGTSATVFRKGEKRGYKATYTYVSNSDLQDGLPISFPVENAQSGIISQEEFRRIPSVPIAYWLSNQMFELFDKKKIGDYGETKKGVLTGNDNKFVRTWFEVDPNKIGFNIKNYDEMLEKNKKWIPSTGGGAFRKWYGNFEKVINMENDSYEIRNCNANNYRLRDSKYYFRECISWSEISSKGFSARYIPQGILFGNSGPVCFFEKDILYFLALVNSSVGKEILKLLSPTMTFGPEQIKRMPAVIDRVNEVTELTRRCIEISKEDWDSYETSWEYKHHPWIEFIQGNDTQISECDLKYSILLSERHNELKRMEEKLNQLFSEIYGLEDEINTKVSDEDIMLRKKDDKYECESFISYAVGCALGRYDYRSTGLVELEKIKDIDFVDSDNIIPITDEEYFEDDIVNYICILVEKIFGKKYLEENLDYLSKRLPAKGENSREIIRNYCMNGFYKWHLSTYCGTTSGKKPIYWLFDSGKENGFKCLIYMHRYNKDLVGLIRSDYLVKEQNAIDNALKNAEYTIQTTTSAVDKAQATKKKDKYIKQLNEIKIYYQALSHVALQRIELDLDDGVKENYSKFQNVEVLNENGKKQIVNLLAKV